MSNRLKKICWQYREQLLYLIFGALATAISYGSYVLFTRVGQLDTQRSVIFSNVLALTFSYVTNRAWVFSNKARGAKNVAREAATFLLGRLSTLVFDWAFMVVTVERLGLADLWMKLISNVIVVIVNYVISKLIVFKKRAGDAG